MNKPMTRSCISTEREKQMVFRTKRLIRARNVVCLRSIFWVCCFPTVCLLGSRWRRYAPHPSVYIRRDLSSNGLLTIVCKRLLIRKLEERFESQSRASRSGIALGVSPLGVSSQVEDHRLEGATIPWPIAIAQGAKQLRQVIGGGHRCLTG